MHDYIRWLDSDAKPNDRLPIIPRIRKPLCSKKCINGIRTKQNKELIRLTQRIQSVTNGCFNGYTGETQRGGKLLKRSGRQKPFYSLSSKRPVQLRLSSNAFRVRSRNRHVHDNMIQSRDAELQPDDLF